jgi:hypothetical protein
MEGKLKSLKDLEIEAGVKPVEIKKKKVAPLKKEVKLGSKKKK